MDDFFKDESKRITRESWHASHVGGKQVPAFHTNFMLSQPCLIDDIIIDLAYFLTCAFHQKTSMQLLSIKDRMWTMVITLLLS